MHTFRTFRWTFVLLLQAFVVLIASNSNGDEPTITVTGNAEIRVVPDQVVITAGVESRAQTVADATGENDELISGILEFLKESGIEDKHVRTDYIAITPIMRSAWSDQKGQQANVPGSTNDPFGPPSEEVSRQPIGYLASRQFAITIHDLKEFEAIYKGLIELGVNRVRGIEFRVSELRQYRDRVRLDAVRAARDKALAMSSELGATLASIKTIRETSSDGYGRYMAQNVISDPFDDSASDPATIAAGQIEITASVEIVFILRDTEL